MKNFEADVRTILDVFNDAWEDNWGFVPATPREATRLADELKLIVYPELTYIAEVDGEPAAVALALPNLNEMIRDCDGKLGPVGPAEVGLAAEGGGRQDCPPDDPRAYARSTATCASTPGSARTCT